MAILRVRDDKGNVTEIVAIKGDKGEDGTVTFEDLTEEQKASLKGDKGDKGDRGDKGDKGDRGDKGDTGPAYTLTSSDRSAIVNDVLSALPTWNGGSY